MSKTACTVFSAFLSCCCGTASAQQGDGSVPLGRAVSAAQRLNYAGTFVYQHGSVIETSRITHFMDGGKEYEHLEVLDGSPREVVREGEEIKCFLPETRTVIVERRKDRRGFPAILPTSLTGLSEFYHLKKAAGTRVAGFDTQSIVFEPKDEYRYGHQFWIDNISNLLIKAVLTNERNEVLENFAFTELKIGMPSDYERIKSKLSPNASWTVHNVAARDGQFDDSNWVFKSSVPGFRKVSAMRRQLKADLPDGLHYVFSDGLASVSVFIEPLAAKNKKGDGAGLANMGAINAYKRVVGEFQIVVMGEVPAATVKKIGEGIEPRKK